MHIVLIQPSTKLFRRTKEIMSRPDAQYDVTHCLLCFLGLICVPRQHFEDVKKLRNRIPELRRSILSAPWLLSPQSLQDFPVSTMLCASDVVEGIRHAVCHNDLTPWNSSHDLIGFRFKFRKPAGTVELTGRQMRDFAEKFAGLYLDRLKQHD